MKNYYSILGVSDSATDEEIKRAYRNLAKRWHPDKNHGNKAAEDRFKEIAEAYETLSDPILRRQHDLRLKYGRLYDSSTYFAEKKQDEKKEQRRTRPVYTEGFLRWKEKKKHADMKRRRRMFVGMIFTFILFIGMAQYYEYYLDQQRKQQIADIEERVKAAMAPHEQLQSTAIDNLDSPFDGVFGEGRYEWLTSNSIFVDVPSSDAVICLQQLDPPYRTIRNEFIFGGNSFSFSNVPFGRYRVKVYEGAKWSTNNRLLGGAVKGGFSQHPHFYSVERQPIVFVPATKKNPYPRTCDTVSLDTAYSRFLPMTEGAFFK